MNPSDPKQKTILLAEDHDGLRYAVATHLRHEGYQVIEALHGLDALRRGRDYFGSIDVLVTDLTMPHLTGKAVADALRVQRPQLPVLFLTGQPIDSGSDGLGPLTAYLRKPFEKDRIKERLSRGKDILRAMPNTIIDPLPNGVGHTKIGEGNNYSFHYTEFAHTTVKEAFLRVAAGQRILRVAKDLGFGSHGALRRCLKSRWWIGEKCMMEKRINRTWNPEKDKLTSGKRIPHPEPICVKANMTEEPLISVELFNTVQEILKENRTTFTQNKTLVNEFLGAGILHCACGCKMYHKVNRQKGKEWSYYICSGRYTKKTDCKLPILSAHGTGYYTADRLIGWAVAEKFSNAAFLQARIEERLAALDSDESRRALASAERVVKDLEARQSNYEKAIGNAKSETVITSLVAKLEALEGELEAARKDVQKVSKTASVKVDPVAAALQVKKDFEGFGELSVSEQKPLLQKYILRLEYVPPVCTGDISAMFNVTMQINSLQHSKTEMPS